MRLLPALFAILFAVSPALADRYDKYVEPTTPLMTDYVFDSGVIKIENSADIIEYMRLKDCGMYDLIKDDIFRQQQMMTQISEGQAERVKGFSNTLRVKIPSMLRVTKYNFNSQSFDLDKKSQINQIETMSILSLQTAPCAGSAAAITRLQKFPSNFSVKLNFPVSLLRVPLSANLAENLYEKLDSHSSYKDSKVLYTMIYVSIEGIFPEITSVGTMKSVLMPGQIDAIDIFTDAARTKRLKRLDYSATY